MFFYMHPILLQSLCAYSRDDDRHTICRVGTWHATKHDAMLRHAATLRHAALRHATPRCSTPRRATLCRTAAPREATLLLAAQCQATVRLAKPRHTHMRPAKYMMMMIIIKMNDN